VEQLGVRSFEQSGNLMITFLFVEKLKCKDKQRGMESKKDGLTNMYPRKLVKVPSYTCYVIRMGLEKWGP
jgi:hypothetical protein